MLVLMGGKLPYVSVRVIAGGHVGYPPPMKIKYIIILNISRRQYFPSFFLSPRSSSKNPAHNTVFVCVHVLVREFASMDKHAVTQRKHAKATNSPHQAGTMLP